MILDFKEIPKANKGGGLQDSFELFTRDFFEILGYKILHQPDRGADGKKDIIIEETRIGISGNSKIKWLVSCKHFANSGKAVKDVDEVNIMDRVTTHKCDGFIGFYSTIPATSLSNLLIGLEGKIQTITFDRENIEKILLESPFGIKLARRFFPSSMDKYQTENPQPIKIFNKEPSINCEYCGKDILKKNKEDDFGIFVMLRKFESTSKDKYLFGNYTDAYFCCKGKCDTILKNKYNSIQKYSDSWVDISKFLNPVGFIKNSIELLDYMSYDNKLIFESNAFIKYKKLINNTFPFVARKLTTKEEKFINAYIEDGLIDFI